MNDFLHLVISVFIGQFQSAQAGQTIPEGRLQECYQQHPFFLEAVALISDEDFSDKNKSLERKKNIQSAFDEKPFEIKQCLADIIEYSKAQSDPEDVKFAIKRLSEISSVVYKSNQNKQNGKYQKGLR